MKQLYIAFVRTILRLRPTQAIEDFLVWPIASRVLGLEYVEPVKLKDGFTMLGSMEDVLSRAIIFKGPWKERLWEPLTSEKLEELAARSHHILVAGSHIGYMVLMAAKHTQGTVHAFEPVPKLYDISKKNIALNSDLSGKVSITQAALGETEGKIDLYVEDIRSSVIPYSGGHLKHNERISVPLATIDGQGIAFDCILLDIEGFEWFALNGAEETLSHRPHLILEISPKILALTDVTPAMILKRLRDMNYVVEYLDEDKDYANIYAAPL